VEPFVLGEVMVAATKDAEIQGLKATLEAIEVAQKAQKLAIN